MKGGASACARKAFALGIELVPRRRPSAAKHTRVPPSPAQALDFPQVFCVDSRSDSVAGLVHTVVAVMSVGLPEGTRLWPRSRDASSHGSAVFGSTLESRRGVNEAGGSGRDGEMRRRCRPETQAPRPRDGRRYRTAKSGRLWKRVLPQRSTDGLRKEKGARASWCTSRCRN